jgi:RhtB (resistance to homoserine/threonine) family protein
MFGIENYWLFVLSGVILNITPGADTMYIVARSVAQGKNAGIVSVLGISTGGLIHTLLAALGLSVILASSQTAFTVVKYAGAAYLIYLGISIFLKRKAAAASQEQYQNINLPVIYFQGLLTNLLNPKVALFFLSFLPQFINPLEAHGPAAFLILGGTFFTTGTIWCLILALAASYFTVTLRKNSKISEVLKWISGIIFISLGLNLAFRR